MAKQVVIENPVINSPFTEPTRHFPFGGDAITNWAGTKVGKHWRFHKDAAVERRRQHPLLGQTRKQKQ